MRKIIAFLVMTSLLMLAACGESKSVSDVLKESIEASKELKSYTTEMKINTKVMDMEMTIEAKGDVTHNPDTIYMEMVMGMPGITMDLETYIVEDEVYMGMFGEWFIMEEEDLGIDSFDQLNEEELEKLYNFIDVFNMTEKNDMYVLTLSGDGSKFEQLLEPYLEATMGDLGIDPGFDENMFDNIKVNSFEMELTIDKKTKIFQTQKVQADIDIDGESYKFDSIASISNVNKVKPIEIPQEIRENAVADDFWDDDYDFEYVEESRPLEEIKEIIDFEIPDITFVPAGYELTDSVYYADDDTEMVYLTFEKNDSELFTLCVYPSLEAYIGFYGQDINGLFDKEETELVFIHGIEGALEIYDEHFMYLTWEHTNGEVFEIMGDGSEISKEFMLKMAEKIK